MSAELKKSMLIDSAQAQMLWRIGPKTPYERGDGKQTWSCDVDRVIDVRLCDPHSDNVFLIEENFIKDRQENIFAVTEPQLDEMNFPELNKLHLAMVQAGLSVVFLTVPPERDPREEYGIKTAVFFSEEDAVAGRALFESWNFEDRDV